MNEHGVAYGIDGCDALVYARPMSHSHPVTCQLADGSVVEICFFNKICVFCFFLVCQGSVTQLAPRK